jgi:hypothetical protein
MPLALDAAVTASRREPLNELTPNHGDLGLERGRALTRIERAGRARQDMVKQEQAAGRYGSTVSYELEQLLELAEMRSRHHPVHGSRARQRRTFERANEPAQRLHHPTATPDRPQQFTCTPLHERAPGSQVRMQDQAIRGLAKPP